MGKVFRIENNTNQISFRATNIDQFNDYFEKLQVEDGLIFTSHKDAMEALLKRTLQLERDYSNLLAEEQNSLQKIAELQKELKENTQQIIEVLPADIENEFKKLDETLFSGEDLTNVEMLEVLAQMATTAPETTEVIKEVEKIVEVEKELPKNAVLILLQEDQKQILQQISDWRFNHKLDQEALSPADVMRKMTFNKASLTNWGGDFYTGITSKQLR